MAAHGLTAYPPTLPSHDSDIPVVQNLSATQFSSLHLSHLLAHPPDHILFPFLHGLEGTNHAQKLFFASNGQPVRAPDYRGLVWVLCEDDLYNSEGLAVLSPKGQHEVEADEDEDDEEDCYSEESASDFDGFAMDMDVDDVAAAMEVDVEPEITPDAPSPTPTHMHPVVHAHRPSFAKIHHPPHPVIDTQIHDRRPSNASTASSAFSSTSISTSTSSTSATTASTSATSPSPSSPSSFCPPSYTSTSTHPSSPSPLQTVSLPPQQPPSQPPSHSSPQTPSTPFSPLEPPPPSRSRDPPILTSTFLPGDLLKSTFDGTLEPEFKPPKVPDGISLRNFGIQVPIYATLSDIVVYSPLGASQNARRLAEMFRVAIEKKALERARVYAASSAFSQGDEDGEEEDTETKVKKELENIVKYNVFVMDAKEDEMRAVLPHLMVRVQGDGASGRTQEKEDDVMVDSPVEFEMTDGMVNGSGSEKRGEYKLKPNTIDFAAREKEEMRELTKASEIISVFPSTQSTNGEADATTDTNATEPLTPSQTTVDIRTTATHFDPAIGQVFLGNSNDVPIAPELQNEGAGTGLGMGDPFDYTTNDPKDGMGYDICIECNDLTTFPTIAHLVAAEEHLGLLEKLWAERERERERERDGEGNGKVLRQRPPPNANAVIHLSFPSSPPSTSGTMASLIPFVKFLERMLQPPNGAASTPPSAPSSSSSGSTTLTPTKESRRWSSMSSFMPSFSTSPSSRTRSSTSAAIQPKSSSPSGNSSHSTFSRPLKILIYSSDGYTESSVPALCLLMAVRGLSLPEAYLELQVVKRRSFFVYGNDLGVLRRAEGRLGEERNGRGAGNTCRHPNARSGHSSSLGRSASGKGRHGSGGWGPGGGIRPSASMTIPPPSSSVDFTPSTSSSYGDSTPSSFPHTSGSGPDPHQMIVPSQNDHSHLVKSRPRASTSPWLPSLFDDHQSWFSDPRFDGSFPSRVLPFLYLGNLNHASNAYMLHALGITHVVSVGECALVPPAHVSSSNSASCSTRPTPGAHFVAGKGPGGQGSLWIEEREGRIKVLDIKGVCDDGIDTLEPQLEPICEWIEKARLEGGQVLVHCRVGVSRSATVTIAYVMKHLNLPLVDAYLIVRSRRLSVLIQPNMRLLYNLCGWEIKLARERAGDDEHRLRDELARALSWPYLAKEVHALNEKYLH